MFDYVTFPTLIESPESGKKNTSTYFCSNFGLFWTKIKKLAPLLNAMMVLKLF